MEDKKKKSLNVLGFEMVHTIQEIYWSRDDLPEYWLIENFSTHGGGTTFIMYELSEENGEYYLVDSKEHKRKWEDMFDAVLVEKNVRLSDYA